MGQPKFVVKTCYNWADEADFPSFCLMTQSEYMAARALVKKYFDEGGREIEIYVGTNEEITFDCYDSVFGGVDTYILTSKEAEVIEKAIGSDYGEISLNRVLEHLEYNMEEDEE